MNLPNDTAGSAAESAYDIRYWIDRGDVIVDISPGWNDFAQANGAPDLEPRRVIGRNLLSFVQGDVTKMYVRTLIQSARLQRRPLVRPYRCDSPASRRYMEMCVSLEAGGVLCWSHRLIREEPLRQRMEFTVNSGRIAQSFVVRCSMCNRLKSPAGWQEPDQSTLGQTDGMPIPVIYGVCPRCMAFPEARKSSLEGG